MWDNVFPYDRCKCLRVKFYENNNGFVDKLRSYKAEMEISYKTKHVTPILTILLGSLSYLVYKSLAGYLWLVKSGQLMRMNFLIGQYPLCHQCPYNLKNMSLMEALVPQLLLL